MQSRLDLASKRDQDRFWSKVAKADGCWLWSSAIAENGYGVFRVAGGSAYAHRVAYFSAHRQISSTLVIDHICRNRRCVNPDHLRQIARGDNVRIGRCPSRESTHCKRGHLFGQLRVGKVQQRVCGVCRKVSQLAYESRKYGTAINEVLEALK
jgi:hypothetical protein